MIPEGPIEGPGAGRGETRLEGTERPLPAPRPARPGGCPRLQLPLGSACGGAAPAPPPRDWICRWAPALRWPGRGGRRDRSRPRGSPVAARSARAAGRGADDPRAVWPRGNVGGGRAAPAPAQRACGGSGGSRARLWPVGLGWGWRPCRALSALEPAEAAKPGPGSWKPSRGHCLRPRAPPDPGPGRLSRSRSWRRGARFRRRARHGRPRAGCGGQGCAGCGHVEGASCGKRP